MKQLAGILSHITICKKMKPIVFSQDAHTKITLIVYNIHQNVKKPFYIVTCVQITVSGW